MMRVFTEGELQFDFSSARGAEKADPEAVELPQDMKFVDFIVEEDTRTLLVEVKDPSQSPVPERELARYESEIQGDALINLKLVPKARGTYTFLHLMQRDTREMVYVVVLGIERLHLDPAHLGPFQGRLSRRLRQETAEPWRRPYITHCIVVSVDTWAAHFPEYPLRRLPSTTRTS
ncbi:MAG: hypothetical protein FJX74_18120 [Armatimonadetes bacterium]|nr:hypothetical protein [Armatimonadota bacterium]